MYNVLANIESPDIVVVSNIGGNYPATTEDGGNQIDYPGIAEWLNGTYIANDPPTTNSTPSNLTQWMNTVNGFAKVAYCTVLSDLGQSRQNMLSSPESGQALVTQLRDIWLSPMPNGIRPLGNAAWQIFASQFFDLTVGTDPPLSNSTEFFAWLGQDVSAPTPPTLSTISAQYLCQVPERKGWGSLLVSVLVADIVFLQVLWKLLCWITTFMVERENEQAKYCIGCAKRLQSEDCEMLEPGTSPGVVPTADAATGAKAALLGKATSVEAAEDESQLVRQRSLLSKPVPKSSPPEP